MIGTINRHVFSVWHVLALVGLFSGSGGQTMAPNPAPTMAAGPQAPVGVAIPRELAKVVLPTYVIEPPDILMIDAIHAVPRPPYRLKTYDILSIQAQGLLPDAPLAGTFTVEPGGFVRLGPRYGAVRVAGLTVEEAETAIRRQLQIAFREPVISVGLADTAARQQIAGQHLVAPDGTVTLGSYGSVSVVGLTVAQSKAVIERYLSQYLENPEVSVEVFAYNSKVYYIITQGAGLGDGVYRFPVTGNETVLDAISQINGLQRVSSKQIWIARPSNDPGRVQNLPVKWEDITANGNARTNYQILPGDRVFIAEDKFIAFDTGLAKVTTPLERIMGFSLLGVGTVTRLSGPVLQGGGNPQGTF